MELTREQAAAILRYYAEIGVDEALEEHAVDRYAESAAPAENRPAQMEAKAAPAVTKYEAMVTPVWL